MTRRAHTVTVSAADGALTTTETFHWTVTNTNRAPVVTAPADQTSAEGAAVTLPIVATDPDGDALTFSATGLPPGLSINPTTGVISGTLPYTAAGGYTVTVSAADGSLTTTETFHWTVANTNRAPVVTALGDQSSVEGAVIALPIVATDPDGDTLTVSATGLPPGLSLTAGVIGGTLPFDAAGAYTVTVSAADGSLTTSETFHWTVTNTNRAPVVTAPADQTSAEGAVITLPIVATDPDGDTLSFSATGLPPGLSLKRRGRDQRHGAV